MRWPIQFQLLLPTLSVVVLAIVLASGVSAYLGAVRARQIQEDNLRRMVATLTEAQFPLIESVLRPMGGLSGAEFVLLDRRDALQASTLPLGDDDVQRLKTMDKDPTSGGLGTRPATLLAGRYYLSQRVAISARDPVSPAGSLIVLYPEDRWSATMRQAAYPALATGALAVVAVVLVTTLLANRFVRPIRQLGDRAAAIARGNFEPMPLWRHDDEIRDLALSINRMAEQLGQYEAEVRRHERLRTLDQLGAGMAHQLRNAATGGRMAIELHRRQCDATAASESLDVALQTIAAHGDVLAAIPGPGTRGGDGRRGRFVDRCCRGRTVAGAARMPSRRRRAGVSPRSPGISRPRCGRGTASASPEPDVQRAGGCTAGRLSAFSRR